MNGIHVNINLTAILSNLCNNIDYKTLTKPIICTCIFNNSTGIQITGPQWQPLGRFSDDLVKTKANVNIKLCNLCETDCLCFCSLYSNISTWHYCKQTWCKKINCMISSSCFTGLSSTWYSTEVITSMCPPETDRKKNIFKKRTTYM